MARKIRRRRYFAASIADPWQRVRQAILILGGVILFGAVGYRILGLSPFDAVYQTVITVTTVGFEEHGPASEVDRAYRWFTLVLALFGVSAALYTLGVAIEALLEGSLNDGFRLRREQRMIDDMTDHVIICGGGRVGRSIADYALSHEAEVVIIDRDGHDKDGLEDDRFVVLPADATDDDVLRQAGINRASALVTALDGDAENVYVTLSARALNPALTIVARTGDSSSVAKFLQAGADRVVNPYEIGGSRMGASALHPTISEFLDDVVHDGDHDVHIVEAVVDAASGAAGSTIGSVIGALDQPPLVLAVRSGAAYTANPPMDVSLAAGDVVIALGAAHELDGLTSSCSA